MPVFCPREASTRPSGATIIVFAPWPQSSPPMETDARTAHALQVKAAFFICISRMSMRSPRCRELTISTSGFFSAICWMYSL